MAKPPTPKPLEISYFLTGYYTYRSQLFAPFRAIGVNIVVYHDPVIDGADFELTDLYQWQQRPGFTQFCSEQLATGEIIDQFYSARALDGVLVTMFDSNQRLATFSGTAINTVFAKTTTAQGYINQVGNTTYYYDGVDAIRSDQIYGLGQNGIAAPTNTVTVLNTNGWLPNFNFPAGAVLLDYNGNIEYSAASTSVGSSQLVTGTSTTQHGDTTFWQTGEGGINQWRTTGYATSFPNVTALSAFYSTNFSFHVPATAIILGAQIIFGTQCQDSSTVDTVAGVSLFQGGVAIGSPKAPGTLITYVPQVLTYGTSGDQWGITGGLTPAIVNDPTFGFGISIDLAGVSRIFLDPAYQMTVYYYVPSGSTATAGASGTELPIWSALPGTFTSDNTLRWDNLGSLGQWLPGVAYPLPSVILDSNNNIQVVSLLTAVAPYNNATSYTNGEVVFYQGQYWTAQQSFSGIVPNSSLAASTTSGSTTTYLYNWVVSPNPQASGATVPIWNTVIDGTTDDGALVWLNIGPGNVIVNAGYTWGISYRTTDGHLSTMSVPTLNTGPILGGSTLTPSNITSFSITSDVVTFIAEQTYSVQELVYVQGMISGAYLNDEVFEVLSDIPSASYAVTNVQVASDVVIIAAKNTLVAGTPLTVYVGSASFLNGVPLVVSATGLTGTQFEATFVHANYAATPDTGTAIVTAQFTAAFTYANVLSTPDVGTVTPIIGQITSTGITDARLNYSAAITNVQVLGNTVTMDINSILFPGNTILATGLSGASFLNDFTLQLDTVTPTQATAYFVHPDYPSTADTGTATFCGIEIYRTADGGGIWYYEDALVNPGAGVPWTYTSIDSDSLLNIQLVGVLAHQNDPPPGQVGSIASPFAGGTLCAFWQGRQWLVQGQYIYFDAGNDCLNGDPHQCFPPGNRFEFPGQIMGVAALDKGLVVLGADYFGLVLGGPYTLSFYPLVIEKNFGISSPNALYQDGQTLHALTTQGQLFEITSGGKTNEGHYVADFIANNFPPASTYVTLHRNGLDSGLFLANGSTTVLRNGVNVGAWSVPYYPVGGIGALNSIETSVGTYSLCAAPTVEAGYIMARNLNSWQDAGGQYTSNFALDGCGITLGNITLSGPGEPLSPLHHVILYADAAGESSPMSAGIVANPGSNEGDQNISITVPTDQTINIILTALAGGFSDPDFHITNPAAWECIFWTKFGDETDLNYGFSLQVVLNGTAIGTLSVPAPGMSNDTIAAWINALTVPGTGPVVVDVPNVAILPNEVSANGTQTGFITIPQDQIVPEPPIGALVSTSLQQLRYPVAMMNSQASMWMHHLQVRVIYPSSNAPHSLKALALKFSQEDD